MFRKIRKKFFAKQKYGFFSTNLSWKDLKDNNFTYNSQEIVVKCRDALLKVKSGEAVCERDSALFDKPQYSWPLLTSILWIVAKNPQKNINIIDFGGSFGSVYFQSKEFLNFTDNIKWNIVEQKSFVDEGRRCFENEKLKFFYKIEEAYNKNSLNILILSSVLQYLENFEDMVIEFVNMGFDYVIIDRTAFVECENKILTLQKIPQEIYNASYPAWFFNENYLLRKFAKKYKIIADFDSCFDKNIKIDGKIKTKYKGFLLEKNEK